MRQHYTEQLKHFLERHRRIALLTGAGCSTASGIPEYRDDNGEWKHARPVQYADFLKSAATRQRYWARSYAGWQRISDAEPNDTHTALAALDAAGRISGLITQNVDNLHRRAGSRGVIDLHGVLDRVRCLACDELFARSDIQARLRDANPCWIAGAGDLRPDGDIALSDRATSTFTVPDCSSCGGVLKPDVVFFGETVPRKRVQQSQALIAESDALLVVGSSLMVFSGFRFVRQARELGKSIAILNRGKTRADELADVRINDDCGSLLAACVANTGASNGRSE